MQHSRRTARIERLEKRHALSASAAFSDMAEADQRIDAIRRADIDGDRDVDVGDFLRLSSWFGDSVSGEPEAAEVDLDGDGVVGTRDFLFISRSFGQRLPLEGDINLDGEVDVADMLVLSRNISAGLAEDRVNARVGWSDGDLNGDGRAGLSDFLILSKNFGATCRPFDGPRSLQFLSIFASGRQYDYDATYTADDGSLLSESSVTITATGRAWPVQPELQAEIVVDYEFADEDRARFSPHPLNPELDGWFSRRTTGIIESPTRIWMHPIRRNQFISTEVAPFPDIFLPLSVGKRWTTTLPIPRGTWGRWGGTTVVSDYTVTARESRSYAFSSDPLNVWRIEATSQFELGESTLTTYFHERFGFVEMDYTNYVGERIQFVMRKARTS